MSKIVEKFREFTQGSVMVEAETVLNFLEKFGYIDEKSQKNTKKLENVVKNTIICEVDEETIIKSKFVCRYCKYRNVDPSICSVCNDSHSKFEGKEVFEIVRE